MLGQLKAFIAMFMFAIFWIVCWQLYLRSKNEAIFLTEHTHTFTFLFFVWN